MTVNNFKTSAYGRKFIESFEGLFLHTYDDGTGVLTIGYGHTTPAGPPRVIPGMTITADQADQILSADLASVEINVNNCVLVTINQNQFDALVSFDFNTGALDRSNVLRAINSNDFGAVAADLAMWCHAGGHVLAGLVRRRHDEGVLFNTPMPLSPMPKGTM
jgi:lysozyme